MRLHLSDPCSPSGLKPPPSPPKAKKHFKPSASNKQSTYTKNKTIPMSNSPPKRRSRTNSNLSSASSSTSSSVQHETDSIPSSPPHSLPPPVSLTSSVKGHTRVFRSWVMANPLVSSAFEDMDKGLAKQTRLNTLHNRNSCTNLASMDTGIPEKEEKQTLKMNKGMRKLMSSPNLPSEALSSLSSSSSSSNISRLDNGIKFADSVHVYYHSDEDTEKDKKSKANDNGSQQTHKETSPSSKAKIEKLKPPSKKLPLEVRRARARMQYPIDPSKPIAGGITWVARNSCE